MGAFTAFFFYLQISYNLYKRERKSLILMQIFPDSETKYVKPAVLSWRFPYDGR